MKREQRSPENGSMRSKAGRRDRPLSGKPVQPWGCSAFDFFTPHIATWTLLPIARCDALLAVDHRARLRPARRIGSTGATPDCASDFDRRTTAWERSATNCSVAGGITSFFRVNVPH